MGLLDQYYRISEAWGVSITVLHNNDVVIDLCSVKTNSNELDIIKKVSGLNGIDQLTQHLFKKSSLAINLSGKTVLHKQIKRVEQFTPENFSQVVPNARFDDFYIQNFISGDFSFVSLIRKTEADRWIDKIKSMGFKPLMLSLGPFPLYTIEPQLNIYNGNLIIDGHVIERDEHAVWTNYHYEEAQHSVYPLKIADEKIEETSLIPYAAAFQLVMSGQLEAVYVRADLMERTLQLKLSDNRIKVQGFIVLIAFFLMLLANYLIISSLNASSAKMTEQVAMYSQNVNNVNELASQVKNKENRVVSLGWENGINKSSIIDQVCALLPPEIILTNISVDPIDQIASRTQKGPVFFRRKMRIIGTSGQIIPVNEWIARIKARAWVKNVQMDSYTFDSELNTGRFNIVVTY